MTGNVYKISCIILYHPWIVWVHHRTILLYFNSSIPTGLARGGNRQDVEYVLRSLLAGENGEANWIDSCVLDADLRCVYCRQK